MKSSPRAAFAAAFAVLAVALSITPAFAQAEKIEVSATPTSGVETAELTISAENFKRPNASHPGIYVVFGTRTKFPSEGSPWGKYIPAAENQRFVAWPGTPTEPAADKVFTVKGGLGSFTGLKMKVRTQFEAQDGSFVNCKAEKVECGVITIGAHGQAHTNAEDFVPVSFASGFVTEEPGGSPEAESASLTAAGTVKEGETYTVTGTYKNYLANNGQGFYLRFGWLNVAEWKPSVGAPAANRVAYSTIWVRPGPVAGGVTTEAELKSNGTFEAKLKVGAVAGHPAGSGGYHFFTVPAHGAIGPDVTDWEFAKSVTLTP